MKLSTATSVDRLATDAAAAVAAAAAACVHHARVEPCRAAVAGESSSVRTPILSPGRGALWVD